MFTTTDKIKLIKKQQPDFTDMQALEWMWALDWFTYNQLRLQFDYIEYARKVEEFERFSFIEFKEMMWFTVGIYEMAISN